MWNRVRILQLLLLFFFIVHSAAAVGGKETGHSIQLTDAAGRTVVLPAYPERVLLAGKAVVFSTNSCFLFQNAGRIIAGTGVTDQGLGDFYPLMDPRASQKLRFANNAGPEQLLSAKPDVVILKHYLRESLGAAVEELDIPVLYFNSESPETFYDDIEMFGGLFDEMQRAEDIIDYYKTKYALVLNRTKNADKPRVLTVSYSNRDGDTAFSVPSAQWLQTRMVEDAGGTAVWKDDTSGGGWNKVNLEQAAAWKPDYIFVISYKIPACSVVEELADSPSLGMLGAEILPFPADYYSWDQPDVRWILGLLWSAKVLHPELFSDIDMREELQFFYSFLYGLDNGTVESEILPRVTDCLAIVE